MILKLFTLFIISSAYAEEQNCERIKNYHSFYECSISKHPSFSISKLKKQEGDAVLDKSTQWKNPEFELKSIGGENAGEKVGSTEISASVSVSQLWIKGAERDLGQAEKRIADIESQETLMNAKKEVLKNLFRYRQIEEELELTSEAVDSFEKLIKQYRGRLARGPEQEITLSLVELALGDYVLKRNHLTTEKAEITARFKGIWGPTLVIEKSFLPPLKERWPDVVAGPSIMSFESRKLIAESDRANAERSVIARESFPEIKAGPVAERTTEGPNQYWSYGFNISMSLPLFSQNSGARTLAENKAGQARFLAEYATKKSLLDREILVQKYKSSVDSLTKSSSREELRKKHDKVDRLFRQGLAGGSIVIEAHRQITEFTEAQHEHEMVALDSFIELKSLNGGDIEEILK